MEPPIQRNSHIHRKLEATWAAETSDQDTCEFEYFSALRFNFGPCPDPWTDAKRR